MARLRKKGIWFILAIVIVSGLVSFGLFYLNRGTIVPASWGNVAGTRSNTANWLNIFQQALLSPVVAALLGIMIVNRYPRHKVGWLLVIISFISGGAMLLTELTVFGFFTVESPLPGIELAAWVNNWLWVVLYSLLLYMLAIFPDGQFVFRRWQIVLSILLLWFSSTLIAASMIEIQMSSSYQIPNPILGKPQPALYEALFSIGLPAMPLTAIALVASAVVRFRLGQGRERQQMKWLLAGVILLTLMLLIGLSLSEIEGFAIGEIMVNASILGPILGIGTALLRHQLYDIDIIFRRTLVYSVVSALLAAIYFGSVVLLQGFITAVGGQQSGIVVVVSTLVIAALFNPVRKRVQALVDSRFYRQKYDASLTLAHFAVAVQDKVEISELQQALAQVVTDTMQPTYFSLWLKTEKRSKKQES